MDIKVIAHNSMGRGGDQHHRSVTEQVEPVHVDIFVTTRLEQTRGIAEATNPELGSSGKGPVVAESLNLTLRRK